MRVVANRKRYTIVRLESGTHLFLPRTTEFMGFVIAGGSNSFMTGTKNTMLDTLDALSPFVGAHSAFPGDVGANEVAGVGYARQPITYDPAAGGTKSVDVTPTPPAIPIPGGQTVAFAVGWSALVAGTARWWSARGGGVPAPFEANDTDDLFTCDQHGLVDGTRVFLTDTEGAALPGGFVEGTIYFVRDATTDTFKLAATSGGAAVDVTVDGAGFGQSIIPQLYETPGTEIISSLTLGMNR